MLEDLFYGNIQPCNMDARRDARIQPLMQRVSDAEDALRAELTDAAKERLNVLLDASADQNLLMMNLAFQEGFRVAAGIAVDLLCEKRQRQKAMNCH